MTDEALKRACLGVAAVVALLGGLYAVVASSGDEPAAAADQSVDRVDAVVDPGVVSEVEEPLDPIADGDSSSSTPGEAPAPAASSDSSSASGSSGPSGSPSSGGSSIPATSQTVYTCPAGTTGPDDANNCAGTTSETYTQPAEKKTVYTCPAATKGPDADHRCTRQGVEEKMPAEKKTISVCPDGYQGPNRANMCTGEKRVEKKTPAKVFLCEAGSPDCLKPTPPVYICPPGSAGPDADRQCTTVSYEPSTVPAESVDRYECPAGWGTPIEIKGAMWCTRKGLDEVTPATRTVDYVCPSDMTGPDSRNECTETKTVPTSVPATATTVYVCPHGTTGPDQKNLCA